MRIPKCYFNMEEVWNFLIMKSKFGKADWNKKKKKSYANANPQHCVKSIRIRSYSGLYFPAFELNTEYHYVFTLNAGKCGPEYGRLLRNAKVVKVGILTVPSVSVNHKYTGSTEFIFIETFDDILKDAPLRGFHRNRFPRNI